MCNVTVYYTILKFHNGVSAPKTKHTNMEKND